MERAERITVFVETLWEWYAGNKRALPWRDLTIEGDTERAYRILVSEVMLQQTQVSRVKIVYKNFLRYFPFLQDLSRASNRDVVLAWRGMGYNSRALRLRDAARTILDHHAGVFPKEMHELTALPGLGHYTAAAVRNFAWNLPTPCLDTNIRRILHRVFFGPERSDGLWVKSDEYLLDLAAQVLEVALMCPSPITHHLPHDTRNWHAALMDFGSLVCTKRNPKWDACPLTKAGVMKAAYKVPTPNSQLPTPKREPGRLVGSTFVPNRIFRGKIIEELRDAPCGLTASEIGRRVCIDWNAEHCAWLFGLIEALKRDHLITVRGGKVILAE